MMRWLALLLCLLPAMAAAQQVAIPKEPSLSLIVEPRHVNTRGAYVQEQILLRVMLISPHPYSALTLDLPPLEGARTIVLREPRVREVQFYNERGYLYETRLALFPESSGQLHIPAIGVAGSVTAPDGTEIAFGERQDGFAIPVRPIDPRLQTSWWLVAGEVTLTESWTPDPEAFRVGEVVRRHVTLTVRGATPEQLPTVEQGRNAGYAVTGVETETKSDLTTEGVVTTISQSWDLLVQSDDVFYISPIRLDYWNAETDAPATALLPALRVEALPYDEDALRQGLIEDAEAAHRSRRIGLWVLLALPVAAIVGLMALALRAALPGSADRNLQRRCHRDASPEAALIAVRDWTAATLGHSDRPISERLATTFGAPAAAGVEALQRHLFAPDGPPPRLDGIARSLVVAARRRRLAAFWRDLARLIPAYPRRRGLWEEPYSPTHPAHRPRLRVRTAPS